MSRGAAPGGGPDVVRLGKEAKDVGASQFDVSGVMAEIARDDMTQWKARIKGPPDSPYAGGIWDLEVVLPRLYPFEPPKVKFINQIWHPNISSVTGAICLDILKGAWSPAMTIKTALLSISALLCSPEPDDPQDAEVASQYKRNREEWRATAKYWTEIYAMPRPESTKDEKVAQLVAMGFEESRCVAALKAKGGDVERALEYLFTS